MSFENKIIPPVSGQKPSFWQEHKKIILGLLATLILSVGVFFGQSATNNFRASILNTQQPAPFDGTALPVRSIPDWASLSGAEYQLVASALAPDKLITLPNYDPAIFGAKLASLSWSSTTDRALINKLVTYATPYMGSYETNSKEYEGSHLAIDIKLPEETPIYVVANGTVVKVVESSSGFGKHIVVRHDNVPLLDSNETATLYSSYSHLGKIQTTKGAIVTRGEQIALSGNTGISSGPHLHFQIDRATAPWHPWWPFSSAEAAAAGVSFFDGVSSGLNQDQAIANTINPMLWVQRYLATDTSTSSDLHATAVTPPPEPALTPVAPEPDPTTIPTPVAPEPTPDPQSPTIEPIVTSNLIAETKPVDSISKVAKFSISSNDKFLIGSPEEITIQALDLNDEPTLNTNFTGEATLSTSTNFGTFTPATITTDDFQDGKATVLLTYPADQSFTVKAQQGALLGISSTIRPRLFNDVSIVHPNYKAISYLKNKKIIGGYPDGTFRPNQTVSRVEALKMIELGLNVDCSTAPAPNFPDTEASAWYSSFIGCAVQHDIVGGYPDGTFGPGNTVNRAEYLKVLIGSANVQTSIPTSTPYSDVSVDAWFAPFAAYAAEKNIISGDQLDGGFSMTRAEVAETIYRMIVLRETLATSYTEDLAI